MGETTGISWTDKTWNPWHGCHKISPGCKNCYMFSDKARYGQDPNVVVRSKTTFEAPLKWPHEPMLCFTCSWSDFFIEEADTWRPAAWDIIRRTPWVTYQVLTKRGYRMRDHVPAEVLPNVILGVSVESQKYADERREDLREMSARGWKTFVSYEPALGDVDWTGWEFLDWGIFGGESGGGARPCNLEWGRHALQQWANAGTARFVKQLGAYPEDEAIFRPYSGVPIHGTDYLKLKDRKGGDMSEWPEDLRVREFPSPSLPSESERGL